MNTIGVDFDNLKYMTVEMEVLGDNKSQIYPSTLSLNNNIKQQATITPTTPTTLTTTPTTPTNLATTPTTTTTTTTDPTKINKGSVEDKITHKAKKQKTTAVSVSAVPAPSDQDKSLMDRIKVGDIVSFQFTGMHPLTNPPQRTFKARNIATQHGVQGCA